MELINAQQAHIAEMARLARDREEQLATLLAPAEASRPSRDGVESIHGLEAVRAWITEVARSARVEALAMTPGGTPSEESLRRGRVLDAAALVRGIRLRTLYLTSTTRWPAMRAHVRRLSELGSEYRTLPTLPMRMLLVDGTVGLLPLERSDSSAGALVVRDQLTLKALRALFEACWEAATPFWAAPSVDDVSVQQRAVLTLLADGAKDEEVALALGVSVRTVRRMMAELSDRLEARSRFQAGVNAVKAGWLPA